MFFKFERILIKVFFDKKRDTSSHKPKNIIGFPDAREKVALTYIWYIFYESVRNIIQVISRKLNKMQAN